MFMFSEGKPEWETVSSVLQKRDNFPLQNAFRMHNIAIQTDCKWCLQPGVATKSFPLWLNRQSGCTILRVMSGSKPVAGTVCPELHWWCLCIFDVEYLMGNAGAGWQGWKATSMPGTRDLISISMQNGDYTLSAAPQGRTFNGKKRPTFQPSKIKFYQKIEKFTISIQY